MNVYEHVLQVHLVVEMVSGVSKSVWERCHADVLRRDMMRQKHEKNMTVPHKDNNKLVADSAMIIMHDL